MPVIEYYVTDPGGKVSAQAFKVTLDYLQEIDYHSGLSVVELPLSSVQYSVSYRSADDSNPIHVVNYTAVDGSSKLIFQIFESRTEVTNPVTRSEFSAAAGSVKFSMALLGWPFANIGNQLSLHASVTLSDFDTMDQCTYNTSVNSFIENTYDTHIECETPEIRGSLSLLGFYTSSPHPGLSEQYETLPVVTVATVEYVNGSSIELNSDTTPVVKACHGKQQHAQIREVKLALQFGYFQGALIYDPDLQVLFQSGGGNGGKHGDCGSSSVESLQYSVIFWLSVAFFVIAVVVSVGVAGTLRFPLFKKITLGREGSRVVDVRRAARNSERPSESHA